ncbi:hypothetical protein Cfor_03843 [Coptotermes formosanus]|uniref:VWFC domain-containing protein n=1 Tax=Coptotermes formosanus TaxID=36987 RepID=A0A6L2P9Y6_COPFO|nr:hypothetical protein Cfor_03843 [Coptotermes formosanus]
MHIFLLLQNVLKTHSRRVWIWWLARLRKAITGSCGYSKLNFCMLLLQAKYLMSADWTRSEDPVIKCRFGGAEYDVGQTWHPRMETQDTVFCVTCQCYQGGRMNCSSKECPVTCSSSKDISECCKICTESRMPVHRPVSPDVVSCFHNGRIYKDGQNFPSNSTGMKVNGPNQCVQCRCQDGVVLCDVQTCQELRCHEPIHRPDNCCPVCPDGSSWHPVIGPFGPMDCVMCQCNSGNIECNRFKCPSREELQCTKPAKHQESIILQEALLRNSREQNFFHIMFNLGDKLLKHTGFSRPERWTKSKIIPLF